MGLSAQDSARIRDISFVAICCVVFQHFCLLSGYKSEAVCFFSEVIWRGILDWPVSWFFLISGFFLARKFDGSFLWWRRAIVRRFRTLFIPYVIWNFLGASIMLLYGKQFTFGDVFSNLGITNAFPVVAPLWYVRNLLLLCIFSPVIIFVCRLLFTGGRWGITLACVTFFGVLVAPFPAKRLFVMPITWFTIGVMLTFIKITPVINKKLIVGCLCGVVGMIAVNSLVLRVELPSLRFVLNALVIINFYVFHDKIFGQLHINQFISESVFFVYCFHGMIMLPIYNSHALLRCSYDHFAGIVLWLMVASGTIVFSVVSGYCIRACCPKFFYVLTGGRG